MVRLNSRQVTKASVLCAIICGKETCLQALNVEERSSLHPNLQKGAWFPGSFPTQRTVPHHHWQSAPSHFTDTKATSLLLDFKQILRTKISENPVCERETIWGRIPQVYTLAGKLQKFQKDQSVAHSLRL